MENSIKGNLINFVNPHNYGLFEIDLTENIIDYLWEISNKAKNKGNSIKERLVGNISNSYVVEDENNYFYNEIILPILGSYDKINRGHHPIKNSVWTKDCFKESIIGVNNEMINTEFKLQEFWVNYQNKHEFNPIHNHGGVYSFVIWLKIPYDYEDQCKLPQFKGTKKSDLKPGCFQFHYHNILGNNVSRTYFLNKEEHEGKMLFFPASLPHEVYPFYDTDEQRVSMSGNIFLTGRKPSSNIRVDIT